jgi:hypothetical protein
MELPQIQAIQPTAQKSIRNPSKSQQFNHFPD